jgi:ribonuclease VapC
MTVLDATAVLAFIHDEPGADTGAGHTGSASLGSANPAEVVGRLVDSGIESVGRPCRSATDVASAWL